MDLQDDLDAYLVGADEWSDIDEDPPVITDDAGVDRLLRAVAVGEREQARVKAVADANVAQMRQWQDDRTKSITDRIAWLRRSLETWARATIDPKAKVRSRAFPSGRVGLKKPTTRMVSTLAIDDIATANTLRALNPSFASVAASVHVVDIKRVTQVGQQLPDATPDADGYVAHEAVTIDDDGTVTVLPGVHYLVKPDDDVTITPTKAGPVAAADVADVG